MTRKPYNKKTTTKTNVKTKKEVIIELQNICKSYGKLNVLTDVNTKIYRGDRIGIIGPNGEGKSTIAEIILRVKIPTKGKVIYTNPNMRVGVQFQDSTYPRSVRVMSMINYYVDAYKLNKNNINLDQLIDYFDLRPYLKKYINSLSGGQKQRLNILLSIMHNPELIILDELTTGLDIEVRERMKYIINNKILCKKNTSLLLVSHNMTEVEELCNRIWFISNGKIEYDMKISEVKKKYKNLVTFTEKIFYDLREKNEKKKKEGKK